MDAPETVVEALALLKSQGYDVEFQLVDGCLRCDVADRECPAADAVVERLFRFEGPSDPGDEMVVFGLRDPVTGHRGVLASGFGGVDIQLGSNMGIKKGDEYAIIQSDTLEGFVDERGRRGPGVARAAHVPPGEGTQIRIDDLEQFPRRSAVALPRRSEQSRNGSGVGRRLG